MSLLVSGRRAEGGAVLVVSLIMLLVMTLLGIGAMDSTRLEMKMASNNQNRQAAFQAAEAGLVAAELRLQSDTVPLSQLQSCTSGSQACFENTCAGGLCFTGSFVTGDDQFSCALDTSSPPALQVWRDSTLDVFNTPGKHRSAAINGDIADVKYVVEFLCFTERGDGSAFDSLNPNNGASLFRITALAVSENGDSPVALQSTYRYTD